MQSKYLNSWRNNASQHTTRDKREMPIWFFAAPDQKRIKSGDFPLCKTCVTFLSFHTGYSNKNIFGKLKCITHQFAFTEHARWYRTDMPENRKTRYVFASKNENLHALTHCFGSVALYLMGYKSNLKQHFTVRLTLKYTLMSCDRNVLHSPNTITISSRYKITRHPSFF